ncbi:MAG TPA: phospholipid carrier-dependent glycosyltransferase [Caulobacteraceae bacterium]
MRGHSSPRIAGAAVGAALVGLIASVNFLAGLGEPAKPIWDEAYYLTSTQRYLEGTAQFASHPPLGLMLIAAGARLSGDNAGVERHALARAGHVGEGDLPAGYSFVGVRLASALAGVAGALAMFALMLTLVGRVLPALAFSNLYLFENAFLVQFRAAQLDSFQVAFAICALIAFARGVRRGIRPALADDLGLGAACALAAMVKLDGAVLALLGVLCVARRLWMRRLGGWPAALAASARDAGLMSAAFLGVIAAVFTLQILVSPGLPEFGGAAGAKDGRFLSTAYGDYLMGRRGPSPSVVLAAARDYGRFMAADLKATPRADPNGSSPWLWPLGRGAITYRWESNGARTAYLQLAGNPVGWFAGLAALAGSVGLSVLAPAGRRPPRDPVRRDLMIMILLVYAALMGVHIWLASARVMYLYHYFIGLVLSWALAPLAFDEACARWRGLAALRSPALAGLTALLLASFLFYAPLTFQRPLTARQCALRNIGQSVVACRS